MTRPETPDARYLAERALGKGAHPKALDRLFELWPEAQVEVEHRNGRNDGVNLKITVVNIAEGPSGQQGVMGGAYCRLDADHWNRQYGISLAFRRALRRLKRVAR